MSLIGRGHDELSDDEQYLNTSPSIPSRFRSCVYSRRFTWLLLSLFILTTLLSITLLVLLLWNPSSTNSNGGGTFGRPSKWVHGVVAR